MDHRPHAGWGELSQTLGRAAGQNHGRLARTQAGHSHVAPEHPALEAGAPRLGARLIGGEAFGVAGRTALLALAPGAFDFGEDAVGETRAEPLKGLVDPANVAKVRADADDQATDSAARAWSIKARMRRMADRKST